MSLRETINALKLEGLTAEQAYSMVQEEAKTKQEEAKTIQEQEKTIQEQEKTRQKELDLKIVLSKQNSSMSFFLLHRAFFVLL